jgi:hypothetical protein
MTTLQDAIKRRDDLDAAIARMDREITDIKDQIERATGHGRYDNDKGMPLPVE